MIIKLTLSKLYMDSICYRFGTIIYFVFYHSDGEIFQNY